MDLASLVNALSQGLKRWKKKRLCRQELRQVVGSA
jgi:hypothetical protein